eukprot:824220-Rhodomonas_salina.8
MLPVCRSPSPTMNPGTAHVRRRSQGVVGVGGVVNREGAGTVDRVCGTCHTRRRNASGVR